MNTRLRPLVVFFIFFFPSVLIADPSGPVRFDEVSVEGTRRIDAEAVLQNIELKSGKLTRSQLSAEIRRIYNTGFFDQVTASLREVDGKRVLQYKVLEKPTIRKVFILGNKAVDEDDLAEFLQFGERRFVDKTAVEAAQRAARTYYQTQGFFDADLTHSVVPVGENQVDITFTVSEGEKYKISRVRIAGLKEVDEDDLLGVIQTKRYKWWNSWLLGTGRVNEEILKNDKALINQFLLDHGYVDATVSDASISKGDNQRVEVAFSVEEGKQYSIGTIEVDGDLIEESSEKTLDGIKLATGDIFSASSLREDTLTISDKFADIGYAFANVVPNTRLDPENAQVHLRYSVDRGKIVSVNRIKVSGNTKTFDNVIRRELKIQEQDTFSSSKVRRSQALLQRLGYFEEVNIATNPTEGADDKIDLGVNVREGSTGTFSIGAGYSSSDGAIFNMRISENNFLGSGRRINFDIDVGSRRDNIVVSLNDRRVNDSFWSAGIDVLMTEREFSDFDRKLAGGGFTIGYPLEEFFTGKWAEDIRFSLRYEYLDIEISNVEDDAAQFVKDSAGNSSSSGFTPRLVRNTINNPLNPTEGSRQTLSLEVTGLGGTEEYFLADFRNQMYRPVFKDPFELTFAWRTRLSWGETFDDGDLPLFRRFFPGGINSVRGFKNRTLGPRDENDREFGGSKQFVNNLEFIFPLLSNAGFKGVIFYDIGEAFDDDVSIEFSELRHAYGAGIRWMSPLGPIRIEFGFPIDREAGEDSTVTLFSFGAPI